MRALFFRLIGATVDLEKCYYFLYEYLVAKFGFDTEKNEPRQVLQFLARKPELNAKVYDSIRHLRSKTVSCAQAIRKALVSDSSGAEGRTVLLSRLAALGGFGFVIGPTIAGRLVALHVRYVVAVHLLLACTSLAMAAQLCRGSGKGGTATHGAPAACQGGVSELLRIQSVPSLMAVPPLPLPRQS